MFTVVGALLPLYTLLAVGGRSSWGAGGAHSNALEAPALRADANVTAPSRHQGGLLRQSVGEGFGQASACAQLAVAEARRRRPRPPLVQGQRLWPQNAGSAPAP